MGAALSTTALDEAERAALQNAVDEALADPRPSVPHQVVQAEIDAEIEAFERRLAAGSAA